MVCLRCHQIGKMKLEKAQNQKIREVKRWNDGGGSALSSNQSCHHWPCPPPIQPIHPIPKYGFPQVWTNLMLQGRRTDNTMGFQIFYDTFPIEACATVRCESQFDFQFDTFIIIFSYITRNLI